MKQEKRNEFIKELIEIKQLLKSRDVESISLGYSMFQSSKFRKYIRNKVYAYRSTPDVLYNFPLYPLASQEEINQKDDFKKYLLIELNRMKTKHAYNVICDFILDRIIIYDRTYRRKRGKRRFTQNYPGR